MLNVFKKTFRKVFNPLLADFLLKKEFKSNDCCKQFSYLRSIAKMFGFESYDFICMIGPLLSCVKRNDEVK